jgi:hypothetical protein
LGHVVQRGVEASVSALQVAVALLEHEVLELRLLHRRLDPLVRDREVAVEALHLVVRPFQQLVVPD